MLEIDEEIICEFMARESIEDTTDEEMLMVLPGCIKAALGKVRLL
jgi:hypothetical protein